MDYSLIKGLDWRYNAFLCAVFVLSLLLLFYDRLSPFWQDTFMPALAVYAIGDAVISTLRVEFTASANTKAMAEGREPPGIPERQLKICSVLHGVWVLLLVIYTIVLAVHNYVA